MAVDREVTIKLQPGQYVVIVSEQIAGTYRVWSDPVEILVEPSRDGNPDIVEMTLRSHECPDEYD